MDDLIREWIVNGSEEYLESSLRFFYQALFVLDGLKLSTYDKYNRGKLCGVIDECIYHRNYEHIKFFIVSGSICEYAHEHKGEVTIKTELAYASRVFIVHFRFGYKHEDEMKMRIEAKGTRFNITSKMAKVRRKANLPNALRLNEAFRQIDMLCKEYGGEIRCSPSYLGGYVLIPSPEVVESWG